MSKTKPSLLGIGDLFGSKKTDKQPSPHVNKSTNGHATKSASKHVNKSVSGQTNNRTKKHVEMKSSPQVDMSTSEESPELVRYTMYFTPELLERLEDVWLQLRREHHSKVPRWKIANLILEEGLRDQTLVERLLKKK